MGGKALTEVASMGESLSGGCQYEGKASAEVVSMGGKPQRSLSV